MRVRLSRLAIVILGVIALPSYANAAALSFSSQAASYPVGALISVSAYVSSPRQAVNAISGTISFPADNLEVVSLSKSGSVIQLWVRDPFVSTTTDKINFAGIALNPGFSGNRGTVLTVVFRAKAPGNASLSFSSGSVLANDGSGTDVLRSLGKLSLLLLPSSGSESASPAKLEGLPAAQTAFMAGTGTASVIGVVKTKLFRHLFSTIEIGALLLSAAVLSTALTLMWFYEPRHVHGAKRKLRGESHEAFMVFEKAYGTLKEEVQQHLNLCSKKQKETAYDLETESSLRRLKECFDTTEESVNQTIREKT